MLGYKGVVLHPSAAVHPPQEVTGARNRVHTLYGAAVEVATPDIALPLKCMYSQSKCVAGTAQPADDLLVRGLRWLFVLPALLLLLLLLLPGQGVSSSASWSIRGLYANPFQEAFSNP